MEALAKQNIFCFEKMALKLGILIMATAVFSPQIMPYNTDIRAEVLKGYIQKETVIKEQDDTALFLLKSKWEQSLKQKYKGYEVKKVAEGVAYVRMQKRINSNNVKINIAEINRNINPKLEIIPKLSSPAIHSKSKISGMVEKGKTLVAINGTYFKQNTGTPLGALVINNEIITGPIYNRVGLAIEDTGFSTAKIGFDGTIKKDNIELKIDNINQPRMLYSQVLIYTRKWGQKSPEMKTKCKQMAIVDGKITAVSDYPLYIPENGIVISAIPEKLAKFELGDNVYLDYSITPYNEKANHIISGGPYLIKSGNKYIDYTEEKLSSVTGRNPRTAIGYTKDNVLILVTVEGRKEGSSGVTLNELAQIMKNAGCYEAFNLDGGSSTVMYVNGNLLSGSGVGTNPYISNALTVRIKV